MSAGHAVDPLEPSIRGASTSFTVTEKEHEDVEPWASVATKVCVVEPVGKVEPLASPAVLLVVTPGQLSVPTGVV